MKSHALDFASAVEPWRRTPGNGFQGAARTAVQSFVGTFTNKLDAKGRVSIPASYRQALASQGTEGVFCIPALGLSAVKAFGEVFHAQSRALIQPHHPLFDRRHADLAAAVFGQSQHLSFDDDGRVRLPDELIAHAGIQDRVCFVGLDTVFELWNPQTYAPVREARMKEALAVFEASGRSLP